MDVQTVLVIILAILTTNLVIVGVYLVLVLKELRETLKRANSVLADVNMVTSVVSNPIASLTTLLTHAIKGFKNTRPVKSLVDFDEEDK